MDLLNVLLGALLPVLVALLTHSKASPRVKSLALFVLTVVSSTTATLVQGWTAKDFGIAFATQFGAAVASHFGLLSPAGATGGDGLVTQVGLGLGAPLDPVEP